MSSKEGFYFTLKANNFRILDNAIESPQLKLRWFDIYVNAYDKVNYEYNAKDEFKWPQYSKKILAEVDNGIKLADFNKLYSYTCNGSLGKWDSNTNSFPINEIFAEIIIATYPFAFNDFTMRYTMANNEYFDWKLKMDPSKAERFVETRKDSYGNVNRNITAKVIYNVVNKSTQDLRTLKSAYLKIYVHKIIILNGTTILGEIKPRVDFFDKVNLIKTDETANVVTDIDGNVYHTIRIGTQVWMVENLKTTKYNDGTEIPMVTDNTAWANLITPGFCWNNNDVANKNTYGALYNWYAVNTGKLAPSGWHIPTSNEWEILCEFLGGSRLACTKLKEMGTSHWNSSNEGSTNESGFTALPGGNRIKTGSFQTVGSMGNWWSSEEFNDRLARNWYLTSKDSEFSETGFEKNWGFSVRCIRDF